MNLPRREGFFVRMRARMGLWPGQVSTAALVQARQRARLGWVLVAALGAFTLAIVAIELADSAQQDDGSAAVAQQLYDETEDSRVAREQHALERRFARALGADLGARPTKQARRRIEALNRQAGGRAKRRKPKPSGG